MPLGINFITLMLNVTHYDNTSNSLVYDQVFLNDINIRASRNGKRHACSCGANQSFKSKNLRSTALVILRYKVDKYHETVISPDTLTL